jgi:hypothetical protein
MWYLGFFFFFFFRKCVQKVQVSLKSDKNNGYFTWRRFHIYDSISLNFSENVNALDKNCRGNQNIYFMFSKFFPANLAVYEMSKTMLDQERLQMTTEYGACALRAGHERAHMHTPTHLGTTTHTRTFVHAHAHTDPRAHTHTHTQHTEKYVILLFNGNSDSRRRFSVTLCVFCLSCHLLRSSIQRYLKESKHVLTNTTSGSN